METQTRLSRHNKFILAGVCVCVFMCLCAFAATLCDEYSLLTTAQTAGK